MSGDSAQSDWWNDFFTGVWPDFLERAKTDEATLAETDFIRKTLNLEAASKVLDVPCGNGRLGLQLALGGWDVTGIDLQPALVEAANKRAQEQSVKLTCRQGDMRDLPWWDEFDAAIGYWSSFGYFDDKGNRDFVEAVWRALKPGGKFLIDTYVTEIVLRDFRSRIWSRAGDWILVEECSYDHENSRVDSDWILITDDQKATKRFSLRVYTYRELVSLLESAGFGDFEALDTATGEPFSVDSARLCLVARKEAQG